MSMNEPDKVERTGGQAIHPKWLERKTAESISSKPIMTCISDSVSEKKFPSDELEMVKTFGKDADWYEHFTTNVGDNPQKAAFLITEIDSSPVKSEYYKECVGAIVVGTSRETGKEVAFLVHSAIGPLVKKFDSEFHRELTARCDALKSQVLPDSIDVVLFGGKWPTGSKEYNLDYDREHQKRYEKKIREMGTFMKNAFGFEPFSNGTVLNHAAYTSGYFNPATRHFFLVHTEPRQGGINKPFKPSKLSKSRDEWRSSTVDEE